MGKFHVIKWKRLRFQSVCFFEFGKQQKRRNSKERPLEVERWCDLAPTSHVSDRHSTANMVQLSCCQLLAHSEFLRCNNVAALRTLPSATKLQTCVCCRTAEPRSRRPFEIQFCIKPCSLRRADQVFSLHEHTRLVQLHDRYLGLVGPRLPPPPLYPLPYLEEALAAKSFPCSKRTMTWEK